MSKKIYYIETNKSWFKRMFKRKGKMYSLCVTYTSRRHDDGWCWREDWITDVIDNSDNLEFLNGKLANLKNVCKVR